MMRKNPTTAEKALGEMLSRYYDKSELKQQPIVGFYLPDFLLVPKLLVIEVDGSFHDKRQDYDLRRTKWLESLGLNVIRFTNDQVEEDIDAVIEEILAVPNQEFSGKRLRSILADANVARSRVIIPERKAVLPSKPKRATKPKRYVGASGRKQFWRA